MRLIAIDPGAGGGIAWIGEDGIVDAEPMPEGMTAQLDMLRKLAVTTFEAKAVMEKTGTYVPGNSATAAVKFARHCGNIEAGLYAYGIPTTQVAPNVWQKSFGLLPKDKAERKREIKERMARHYPHIRVTLATADALGILTWARQQYGL